RKEPCLFLGPSESGTRTLGLDLVDLTFDGNTTQGVLADLVRAPAASDVVTLRAGGNDLLGGVLPRAILRRLHQIAERIQPLGPARHQHHLRPERRQPRCRSTRTGFVAAGDDRAPPAPKCSQSRDRAVSRRARLPTRRSRAALPRARPRIERAVGRAGDRIGPRWRNRHRRALIRAPDIAIEPPDADSTSTSSASARTRLVTSAWPITPGACR